MEQYADPFVDSSSVSTSWTVPYAKADPYYEKNGKRVALIEYDDQYDDLYDWNQKNKGRSSDAKKREKKQIDDMWGKRGSRDREKKSKDLHDSKKGTRNDDNKSWGDLKKGNYWFQPELSRSWWEKPVGVGLIIIGEVASGILAADDATGIGALDDPLIIVTQGTVAKGLQMIMP